MLPQDLKYSHRNAWCRIEAERVIAFGLTEEALRKLTHILYVELPDVGDDVLNDVPCGEIETVGGILEIYPPVDGEVVAVNTQALDAPERVLKDPYGEGWLLKVRLTDPSQLQDLLSAEQYAARPKQSG